jgi:tetratricopeptide (TPR) repeat protein
MVIMLTYEPSPYECDFSGGFARIKSGDQYGFIDKTGKISIPPQFIYVGLFSEGLACVKLPDFQAEADACLNRGEYDKAVEYYLKAGENEKDVYRKAADFCLNKQDFDRALAYYLKAGENRTDVFSKIADFCLEKSNFEQALAYYTKTGKDPLPFYKKIADKYMAAGREKRDSADYHHGEANKLYLRDDASRQMEKINRLLDTAESEYHEASALFNHAVEYYEKAGDKAGAAAAKKELRNTPG